VVSRFESVTISRRLYQDSENGYHFLLDEYLGWKACQAVTPSVGEVAISLAGQQSPFSGSRCHSRVIAGVLSSATVHQLVQKTAEKAIAQEQQGVESCYRREVP
jgi:hypothetical protein